MPVSHVVRAEIVAAVVIAIVATVLELRTREIPNWLTLPPFFIGMVLSLFDHRFVDHWAGIALAVIVMLAAYRLHCVGGGGVKLSCGASALLGLQGAAAIVGLFVALMVGGLAYHRLTKRSVEVPTSPVVLVAALASIALGVGGLWVGRAW